MPVAATLVLFPSAALAFFPAPAVWMDVKMDARRVGVSVWRVLAVAVFVANDPRRCAQLRHSWISDMAEAAKTNNFTLVCMVIPLSKDGKQRSQPRKVPGRIRDCRLNP